jgi:RNA polymerase sigma-70 factor, ECF subfamily
MFRKKTVPEPAEQLSGSLVVPSLEEDAVLMARLKDGDNNAFAELFNKYRAPVFSYLVTLTRKRSVAEELTQETFMRVFAHRSTYQPSSKFTSWLWTIARHLAYDHFKKKTELLLAPDPETNESPIDALESPLTDAETLLIQKSAQAHVDKCLDGLTPQQREAFVLRSITDLSYDEISEKMSSSLSSVKSLLHRAKDVLLTCLKKRRANE